MCGMGGLSGPSDARTSRGLVNSCGVLAKPSCVGPVVPGLCYTCSTSVTPPAQQRCTVRCQPCLVAATPPRVVHAWQCLLYMHGSTSCANWSSMGAERNVVSAYRKAAGPGPAPRTRQIRHPMRAVTGLRWPSLARLNGLPAAADRRPLDAKVVKGGQRGNRQRGRQRGAYRGCRASLPQATRTSARWPRPVLRTHSPLHTLTTAPRRRSMGCSGSEGSGRLDTSLARHFAGGPHGWAGARARQGRAGGAGGARGAARARH